MDGVKRIVVAVSASLGLASAGNGASLTMDTDKTLYGVGESVVVRLLGDAADPPPGGGVVAIVDVGR